MLLQLWLPILLSGVSLFFASFLSWMVFGLHKKDWQAMPQEDEVIGLVKKLGLERGKSYMFPYCDDSAKMKDPEFQKKLAAGPNGVVTVFAPVGMGPKLLKTIVYFWITCFCLAYLGSIGLPPGTPFITVFRFFAAAGLLTYLSAMVSQSIWFDNRIVGHIIESIGYAVIVGAIFGGLWPTA